MAEDPKNLMFRDDWDAVEEQQAKNEERAKLRGIGNLNLRKDQEAQIVFLTGSPVQVYEHFVKGLSYNPLCTMMAEKRCNHCGPKNKPSFRGYFLILNRAYAHMEKVEGDEGEIIWRPKKDENGKAIVTPRLMVLGRGMTDLNGIKAQGIEINGKPSGVLLQEFKIKKIGEGTSSALTFFHKGQAKLTKEEKELINGRGEAEFKELVKAYLLNPRNFSNSTSIEGDSGESQAAGEEVDWDDK